MSNKHLFLNKVTEQVKSKEAKQSIKLEMEHHIQLAKKGWIRKGLTEKEAEEKAINEMGSPIQLGRELSGIYRPIIDWVIVALTVSLLMIGILPTLSSPLLFIAQKLFMILLGITIVIGFMYVDYRKFADFGYLFYLTGSLILITVIFFNNITINGMNYIKIGPIIIKGIMAIPFFLLAWASFFSKKEFRYVSFLCLFFFSCVLFLFGFDSISTVFIYIFTVAVMLFWSGFSKKKVFITFGTGTILLLWMLFITRGSYQLNRLMAFIFPERYAQEAGYFYLYLEKIWANLKWIGPPDMEKLTFINNTDTVFLQLTYQFGYVMAVILVLLFGTLILKMITNVKKTKNQYAKFLLIGSITLYSVQVIYNLGMCMGFLPVISLSLPFISYGVVPTVINALLIGLILSVIRRKNFQ
ncbi:MULTISPECIES: FtsW/RodA/SpoVE family cell cycle protein [Niallia]|uniref:FtsW/RodA/SpoVE family cell cycle protein n=1 Tax=Niallia circulans TaxID=1397 RepID=A0A941JMV7_NIACI|nr:MULTISPECIES: FtsW/RodA/SpoVE family cell cycle protein [Niallia]MCB5237537.1 FtsW/RodA/SpoVE family cell cycle protein [Niallia circulans]MED3794072.1 FtsW/RodA/SpoVE family cell cycle protein [Niallia alba]